MATKAPAGGVAARRLRLFEAALRKGFGLMDARWALFECGMPAGEVRAFEREVRRMIREERSGR